MVSGFVFYLRKFHGVKTKQTKPHNKKWYLEKSERFSFLFSKDEASTTSVGVLLVHVQLGVYTDPKDRCLATRKKLHCIWHKVEGISFPFLWCFSYWLSCILTPWQSQIEIFQRESIRNSKQKVTKKTPKTKLKKLLKTICALLKSSLDISVWVLITCNIDISPMKP